MPETLDLSPAMRRALLAFERRDRSSFTLPQGLGMHQIDALRRRGLIVRTLRDPYGGYRWDKYTLTEKGREVVAVLR